MAISKIESTSLASGVPSRAQLPAGTVLQVVNATLAGLVTSSSSTRSDTGLTASITPTSASSKILVLVSMAACSKTGGAGSGPYLAFWAMRNSSDIFKFEGEAGYTGNTGTNSIGTCSTSALDSPATTSATTYKVQFCNAGNTGTAGFNNSSSTSSITLMEIAA